MTIQLLVLALLILVPGLGATSALYPPGTLPLSTRLALVFGLGFAIVGGVAFALTIPGVLTPVTFWPILGAITVAAWVVALRRGSLREHGRALAEELRGERWPLLLGLLVILAYAVLRVFYLDDFPTSSPFRYWIDGVELADAGGIPDSTLHYGALWPPVTSKIFLNTFTAGAHYATAGHDIQAIAAMLWLTAVAMAVGLWATGRELGLRWTAPLLPVLLIANQAFLGRELTIDLIGYRAELVGRMVVFCALPLGIRALRERRSFRDPVVAGAVFAAGAGTHLVAFITIVIILFWYAVARWVIDLKLMPLVRHGGLMALTAGILTAAVLLLPRGSIGFEGAADPAQYRSTEVTFDKSRFLFTGSTVPASYPPRGRFYVPPGGVVHTFVSDALRAPPGSLIYRPASSVLLGVTAALVALLILFRFPLALRTIGVVSVGLAGSLIVLAAGFSFMYDVFIPATFGIRRLFDYASMTVVLILLAFVEAGLPLLRRWRSWAPGAAAVGLVVVVTAVVMPTARLRPEQRVPGIRAREALAWVRQNTQCDARLLANQRTLGAFRGMTGRVAVLEGMGPFLRPRMLDTIVEQLLGARAFYADPAHHQDYLTRYGIDYVLFLKGFQLGQSATIGTPQPETLEGVPFLRPVHRSKVLDVYRVVGLPEPARRFPDPADHPAYHCERGPIR